MSLSELKPFDVDGHRVSAFVQTANVSTSGPAILSNARWVLQIDNVQMDGGLDAQLDDSEGIVRQHMIHRAKEHRATLRK